MYELIWEELNIRGINVWSEIRSGDIVSPCFIDVAAGGETDQGTLRGIVLPELEDSQLQDNSDIIR